MTVRELMEALKECSPDLEVITEGCDCFGDVGSVVEERKRDLYGAPTQGWHVILKRKEDQ